jgi:carbazole 1,9a-dioxygenase terminal dioxygenase component
MEQARRRSLGSIRKLRERWAPYREAALGFRNHWYPVCFGRDLESDKPKVVRLCGEDIILRRVEGRIFGVEDRCAHRCVPLSHMHRKGIDKELQCLTADTVTCWYHGFTYSFRDGSLVKVITWPDCDVIGKVRIRSYAVREARGLVFVFIGDGEPPDLARDVAPGFLDADHVVEGRCLTVQANWRWGAENGFDSTHIYMHRNSILFENSGSIVPLGLVASDDYAEKTQLVNAPDGPTGVIENLESYEPVWECDIGDPARGGASITAQINVQEDMQPLAPVLSMWLPCLLSVDGFPLPGECVYEFYVPIDESSHLYFQLMGKRCAGTDEEEKFRHEVLTRWRTYVQDGFNGDDVAAREGLQIGYTRHNGWMEEHLTHQDSCIVEWRNLASRYNRGIQRLRGTAPQDEAQP